jgi:hypothetical protein
MINVPFGIGDYITNGSSAGRVIEVIEKDARWGCPAVRIQNIGTEQFGGNVGMSSTVPDYLLSGWSRIPFEWAPVTGGKLEERYTWTAGYTRLQRELRPVGEVTP